MITSPPSPETTRTVKLLVGFDVAIVEVTSVTRTEIRAAGHRYSRADGHCIGRTHAGRVPGAELVRLAKEAA